MKSTLCILLCLISLQVSFAQKRAFKLADLYAVKAVADPQISPDGKRVLFTMTESFLAEGKTNSGIYLMNVDGTNQRRLTGSSSGSYQPRWSTDGEAVYFLSARKDGPQAWMLPLNGGEPQQLTKFSTGVSDPIVTGDGGKIVFASDVYPECGANDECNKTIDENMEKGPIKAHMADHLLYRHWTSWKDGKRSHTFVYDIAGKNYVDVTPGDFDAPAFSLGGGTCAVSPDGKEICYVSNHDPNEAETTNKDLFLVSVSGGESKNITDDNEAYDGEPAYSPDGKYIAYKLQHVPAYESDCFRIGLYERSTGKKSVLTEEFNNWVGQIAWTPNSQSIYFTAEVAGHWPLYSVDVKTRAIKKILDVKTIDGFDISPDGKFLLFTRRAVGEPVELWRASSQGGNIQRLTFFNKPLDDSVDIRPAEEMWITSPTGAKIHTFIVKPHNFDPSKKYPLILNVHGGPQSQWADAFRGDWQMYPGSGYIVVFPNPHGSTGYGQEFTAAISKDWDGKVYTDIMAVADSVEKLPFVDKDRIGAMGWSYGGYMMMWLEGHTNRFKAIASMMGVYDLKAMHGTTEELWFPQWDLNGAPWESDLYVRLSPNQYVKNFKTPCLVITGELDYRVSYTQSLEFFTDLQKMNVPSRLIVFPNDGHWPSGVKSMPVYYNAHLDWFHKYLGGDPAPYDMTKMIRNQSFK